VAGTSSSDNGQVLLHYGSGNLADCWILKLDGNGNLVWQKTLGGTNNDVAFSITKTIDGGYAVAGFSASNDSDVTGHHGTSATDDYWVVKLDSNENMQWEKSLGGTGDDWAYSVIQTTDHGYAIAGYSDSNDGDVNGNHGNGDEWIVKLDSTGVIQWSRTLGGSGSEQARSIIQSSDGGYVVVGETASNDGDVIGYHGDTTVQFWEPDYWIVKLDGAGNIQWQKALGGTSTDQAYSILQTSMGDYVVAGQSGSNDGDVTFNHYAFDYWIVKLDGTGNILWQNSFGGTGSDEARSVAQSSDGGFVVTGISTSNDGDVTGQHGNGGIVGTTDYWVVKLDSVGSMQWQKSLGGNFNDWAYSAIQVDYESYVVAGGASSQDGDVTGNHDGDDFWVVKLGAPLGINQPVNSFFKISPNPGTGIFQIQNSSSPIQTAEAFNLLGEKVFSTSNFSHRTAGQTSNSIDLSTEPDGVYFLHLKTGEGIMEEGGY